MKSFFFLCSLLIGFNSFANPLIQITDHSAPSEERIYFETNYGDFVLKLYSEELPELTAHLKKLVRLGLYAGLDFSSAEPKYYVQLDDVKNNLTPLSDEQLVLLKPLEFIESGYSHQRGRVSLTPDDDGNAESALTIIMADSPHLDGSQTVIGEIEHGLPVLDIIEKLETTDEKFFKIPVRILMAGLLSPEAAAQKYDNSRKQATAAEKQIYSLYAFVLIILLALAAFSLFGKISSRSQLAFVMVIAFVAVFSSMILFHDFVKGQKLLGAFFFFSMIALYKFLNRFESQKS